MSIKKQLGIIAIFTSSLLMGCPSIPTPPPAPIVTELIVNGGFESINSGWSYSSFDATRGVQAYCARTGSAYGALSNQNGLGDPDIGQDFIIPSQGKTMLEFSVRVDTLEDVGISTNFFRVFVGSGEALVGSRISTGDVRDRYFTRKIDISNRKGRAVTGGEEVTLYLKAEFRSSKSTVFCIDDVSVINTQ
jgi:hypothetical protein